MKLDYELFASHAAYLYGRPIEAQNRVNPVLSFFVLFLGLRGLPEIVVCNVIDDLDGTHAAVPELDMGLA